MSEINNATVIIRIPKPIFAYYFMISVSRYLIIYETELDNEDTAEQLGFNDVGDGDFCSYGKLHDAQI